ncbi:flippase [Klebsiella pneumoniae]|nr:flippase [Klebsiella pneumoniae]
MNKNMFKNTLSLFLVQGAAYFLPLITLPYLVRVLGPGQFGVLGFSLSFVQYFTLIVQYGFDLSVTHKIAINKDNKNFVSKVFWGVLICKSGLLAIGALVMLAIVLFVPQVESYSTVIIFSYTSVIGTALLPTWLFQGKEKMGWMAISNISAKVAALPLLFLFIHSPKDTWIVALITGFGFILGSLISFYFIYREKWIEWSMPDMQMLKDLLREGRYIFVSNIASSLYINSIPVILGLCSGPVAVGIYVAADKIRMALQGLMSPITQVFYPRISYLIATEKSKGMSLIRNLLYKQNFIIMIISLFMVIFSKQIIILFYGETYQPSVSVLAILSPILLSIGISTVLGLQGMLILGMQKEFSQILWIGAILNTIIIFPLIWLEQADGAAMSVLLTETLVALMIIYKTKFIWKPSEAG